MADPAIFVLDEATSAIDLVTEARLQQVAGTPDLQSHQLHHRGYRLSTIQNADLVLVLDRGRIVERGTPAELSRRARLFRVSRRHAATRGRVRRAGSPHELPSASRGLHAAAYSSASRNTLCS